MAEDKCSEKKPMEEIPNGEQKRAYKVQALMGESIALARELVESEFYNVGVATDLGKAKRAVMQATCRIAVEVFHKVSAPDQTESLLKMLDRGLEFYAAREDKRKEDDRKEYDNFNSTDALLTEREWVLLRVIGEEKMHLDDLKKQLLESEGFSGEIVADTLLKLKRKHRIYELESEIYQAMDTEIPRGILYGRTPRTDPPDPPIPNVPPEPLPTLEEQNMAAGAAPIRRLLIFAGYLNDENLIDLFSPDQTVSELINRPTA